MYRTILVFLLFLLVFSGCNMPDNGSDAAPTAPAVDTTSPTGGSIEINGGNTATNSLTVELALNASGASRMMLSNSNDFTAVSWETYSTAKTWTLISGADGTRTVYVKFSDDAGNETEGCSDSIDYDSTSPTGGAVEINGGNTATNSLTVELTLSSSGASRMMLSNSNDFTAVSWETYSAAKTWTIASGADGTKTVYVKFSDDAGNETEVCSDSIDYDGGIGIPSNVLLVNRENISGACNGETWSTAYVSMQDALNDTDLSGNGGSGQYTEIWISKGSYTSAAPLELKSDIKIYGGFSVGETDISSRDIATNPTVLSGSDTHTVIFCDSPASNAVLDGLTILKGATSSNGGGISCTGGNLVLINCTVENNYSGTNGGGISLTGGNLELKNCTVESNYSGTNGGGIYLGGGMLILSGTSAIQYNRANNNGGGIYITAIFTILQFDSGSINDNHATQKGGGIHKYGGDIFTGDGHWNGPPSEMRPGNYETYFSVDQYGRCHEFDLSYPAKVYDNNSTRGSQMKIEN